MRITWNTDVNAPCCPGEIVADDGQTRLIQTDFDYPGVASSFGWSLRDVQATQAERATHRLDTDAAPCDHNGTDGSVDCPQCGLTASDFIAAAGEWLVDNDGATADDPGYFE